MEAHVSAKVPLDSRDTALSPAPEGAALGHSPGSPFRSTLPSPAPARVQVSLGRVSLVVDSEIVIGFEFKPLRRARLDCPKSLVLPQNAQVNVLLEVPASWYLSRVSL